MRTHTNTSKHALQDASRWEREVARLQATAAADLERIRKEAADTAEREVRLLRCKGGALRVLMLF